MQYKYTGDGRRTKAELVYGCARGVGDRKTRPHNRQNDLIWKVLDRLKSNVQT